MIPGQRARRCSSALVDAENCMAYTVRIVMPESRFHTAAVLPSERELRAGWPFG